MTLGYYYLHVNKDLFYKVGSGAIGDIRESDFCHTAWAWDGKRQTAWTILVEALALGASKERIQTLAKAWDCNEDDALQYAASIGVILEADGSKIFAKLLNFRNLQHSVFGEGATNLEALASLCKALGYLGGKMWNNSFIDLIDKATAFVDNEISRR